MRSRRRAREPIEAAPDAVAHAAALDDARALAVELSRGVASLEFDAVSAGLILFPGETVYRSVGAWLSTPDRGSWAPPSGAEVLITDRRLICRCDDARLLSLSWRDVTGLQIRLEEQHLVVNYDDDPPIAFMGVGVAALAVGAVVGVYGLPSLLTHPALSPLRSS
ncbi:MAG: hypothetical protein ACTHOK_02270 [Nocardioidaceae bacterium]